MKQTKLDDKIGEVTGTNAKGEFIEFELLLKDVKHIRRCLKYFDHIRPSIEPEDLTQEVIDKFMLFGKRKRRLPTKTKAQFKKITKKKCAKCDETEELEIDHIERLSQGGSNKISNLQYLCIRHHQLKNLHWRIEIKKRELDILRERRENLKSGTVKYLKVKCCMCGRKIKTVEFPELDIDAVFCNKHKGDEMVNFIMNT